MVNTDTSSLETKGALAKKTASKSPTAGTKTTESETDTNRSLTSGLQKGNLGGKDARLGNNTVGGKIPQKNTDGQKRKKRAERG